MTNSHNLFEQFRSAEERISEAWGEFTLFGLFERDDIPGKFDVIASATWLFSDRSSLNLLAEMVRNNIRDDNWWPRIGKFVLLDQDDPFVTAVLSRMPNESVRHDLQVLNDLSYDGEIIRNAVIITAQHPIATITPQPVAA